MQTSQKGFIIPLLIIIVVALTIGGGTYVVVKHSTKTPPPAKVQDSSVIVAESSSTAISAGVGGTAVSLRDLFKLSKDLVCNFSAASSSEAVSGTVYSTTDGMIRADVTMQGPKSGKTDGHMIKTGDDVYAWTGGSGAKLRFDQSMQTTSTSTVDLDQKVSYSCSNWTKDSSKFTVPTNVKFIDISAMMHGGAPGAASATVGAQASVSVTAQCAACEQLPASAKAQCKAALQCK
jgi:hypothetical protein